MHSTVPALYKTDLPLPGRRQGKVRDMYELPAGPAGSPTEGGALLIVASDRVSAFDVVLPTPIPGKGALLTDISTRWLRWIEAQGLAKTHLRSVDAADVPGLSAADRDLLQSRVTIGCLCDVVPIECIVRGHLTGSGWVEYQRTGAVSGVVLPAGLTDGDELPEPIFTPSTKAQHGAHDENISFARACDLVGAATMATLRDSSLAIYNAARAFASVRGLILVDTKFEFGTPKCDPGAAPIVIDEALTPDSSRYWPAESWSPSGRTGPLPSFDKQFVRDYLLGLVEDGAWNKEAPGPELPGGIVAQTLARYEQACRRLFGG